MSESDYFGEIAKSLAEGKTTVPDLIKMLTNSYVDGVVDKETFMFGLSYFRILEKATSAKKEDQLLNLDELVNCGLFSNIDEVYKTLKEHNLEDRLRCNPIISPEPTESEITQIYDSEDASKVCIICTHRKRHVVNIPCGHSIMCSVCSEKYVESKTQVERVECIMCKKEIKSINRIYIS